jgi:selenide,water dikinase
VVSNDFADDAAVVRYGGGEGRALVMTADVITPLVDDAETFGEIAATNSLSDIYAMGGRPLWALNLLFFPEGTLPNDVMSAILCGALRACSRAGVDIVGGHTMQDTEVKFGLSVVGEVKHDEVLTNRGGRPGQALVLTKALGTGIIGTAIKAGAASDEEAAAAVASMTALNGDALAIARGFGVTACTDVTGFGVLGHLRNILLGSGLAATVYMDALPLLPGALHHASKGLVPGGSKANLRFFAPDLKRAGESDPLLEILATDAQTSGGLLLCADAAQALELTASLRADRRTPAAVIGTLREPSGPERPGAIELRFAE